MSDLKGTRSYTKALVFALCAPYVVVLAATRAAGADAEPSHPQISRGVVAVERIEKGVLFADDFEGGGIDETDWRIWMSEPDQVDLAVNEGRFVAKGTGSLSHNGLWLKHNFPNKDLVLVSRMDIRSRGGSPHHAVLHLCGGDMPHSPDHWVEIVMRDAGDTALFSIGTALPKGFREHEEDPISVARPATGGFLAKLELNSSTNMCTASVKDGDQWKPLGVPLKLQVRTTHCEIKLHRQDESGPAAEGTSSEAWFDEVRMYPRPAGHPVLFRLVTRDGRDAWYLPGNGGWPPIINIGGKECMVGDLVVELWTGDGETCVYRVQSPIMGHYMMSLENAPWDVYPVDARVRVLLDGRQLGDDALISVQGLDGMYPDDVWNIVME